MFEYEIEMCGQDKNAARLPIFITFPLPALYPPEYVILENKLRISDL